MQNLKCLFIWGSKTHQHLDILIECASPVFGRWKGYDLITLQRGKQKLKFEYY